MRIMHVCIGNYYADGYGYQENLLTKYNKLQGNDIVILTSTRNYDRDTGRIVYGEPSEYINEDGILVKRVAYSFRFLPNSVRRTLGRVRNFRKEIEAYQPNLVFAHNLNFLDMLSINRYKKKNPKTVWFVDNHGDYINSGKNWLSRYVLHGLLWKGVARRVSKNVDKFYGVLPIRCQFLNEVYGIPCDKIELLPMGADDNDIIMASQKFNRDDVRRKLEIPNDAFMLVTGGQIDRRKNIHVLIQAINELKNEQIYLVLFGNIKEDIKDEIEEKLLNNSNVLYVGWQAQQEIYGLFMAADLGVFPGTHSVLWEQACACGLPCIFKQWQGIEHVNIDENCVLLEETSKTCLAEYISSYRNNREMYSALRKNAQAMEESPFLYSKISEKVIKDYRKVVDERR